MKSFINSILLYFISLNYSNAQSFSHLNYINYQVTSKDITSKASVTGFIKLWFNDSLQYEQEWPKPVRFLNSNGTYYTKKDSVANAEFIEAYNKSYFQEMRNTKLTYTNADSSTFFVDYNVQKNISYYFKQKAYKNRLSDIVLLTDSTKIILGHTCNLAIGNFSYPNTTDTFQMKFWYAVDIKTSISPFIYMKNSPGLVMAIDCDKFNYYAINIEIPAKTIGYFSFDIPSSSYHTREEYNKVYAEYFKQFTH